MIELLFPVAVSATEMTRYQVPCWYNTVPKTCVVRDLRNSNGFLIRRMIRVQNDNFFLNEQFRRNGYEQSVNGSSYRPHQYAPAGHLQTRVHPSLVVKNISWD